MERVLRKLARQLDAYDEASLTDLWEKLAADVHNFEPTKRWEESALALGLIQAKRWKNTLHNYHMRETSGFGPAVDAPGATGDRVQALEDLDRDGGSGNGGPVPGNGAKKRKKVLRFRPLKDD